MQKIEYPVETKRLILAPYTVDYCEDLYNLKLLPETHRYNYSLFYQKTKFKSMYKLFAPMIIAVQNQP